MKIYWTIKSVPEFSGMSSKQIKEIWMPYWKTYRYWQQWVMLVLSLTSIIFPLYLFMSEAFSNNSIYLQIVAFLVPGLVWLFWGHYSIVLGMPYIRNVLNESKST